MCTLQYSTDSSLLLWMLHIWLIVFYPNISLVHRPFDGRRERALQTVYAWSICLINHIRLIWQYILCFQSTETCHWHWDIRTLHHRRCNTIHVHLWSLVYGQFYRIIYENSMHVQTVSTRPFLSSPRKGLNMRLPVHIHVCHVNIWYKLDQFTLANQHPSVN